jgi:hypothetical protein
MQRTRSTRGLRAKFVVAVIILTALLGVACNALLDFDAFKISPTGGVGPDGGDGGGVTEGGGGDGGCLDPTGFGGRGCWRCPATTNEQFLNACTGAIFEPFDNATRIKDFDPSNPKPPLVDGGANPPRFDAGPSSVATVNDAGCPFGDEANYPNPVLILGATGFPMETIARAMANEATVYFADRSSCFGVSTAVINKPKVDEYLVYYDKNNGYNAASCRISPDLTPGVPADGMNPDIALSGLFPDSCSGTRVDTDTLPQNTQLPSDWKNFLGPVNPVMFAVHPSSTQKVISAEAAYRVYGFGSGSSPLAQGVVPWIDESFIFRRTGTSATQQAVARSLGMGFDSLRGVDSTGSTAMRRALQSAPADKVENTLGISTSEIVDVNRTEMKTLAYQHSGQTVGFYPDGDPGQFDRRNVRDGHYFLWIPLQIFTRVDTNGDPVAASNVFLEGMANRTRAQRDEATRKLVFVMANRQEAPNRQIDLFGAIKRLGDVPQCAMRVTRTKEGADLTPFTPPTSCACAFEAATPGSILPDCKACTQPSDCTGSSRTTCAFGFCE